MFRAAVAVLVVVMASLSAAAEAPSPPSCFAKPCIQVGSFNIKYLGDEDRSPEDLEALAELIWKHLDLEVVALQEIDTGSEDWATLKGLLAGQGYLFQEGTTSERNQFVVLAWDGDEVAVAAGSAQELSTDTAFTHPADPQCHYEGLRRPVAARFTAGAFDFWVIGVHLKSRSRGRPPNLLPYGCPGWIREQQAAQLVAQLNGLVAASGESDVLLVGDFNEAYDHDSLRPLRMAGFTSQMAYRMAGSRAGSYLPGGDEDLIDHVWLDFYESRELARRSGFVFVPADEEVYLETLSDHVPVWASFHTDADRD